MRIKPLSLLLLLMLLQTCGNASIIERFSIEPENGAAIFVEDGKKVGYTHKGGNVKDNVQKVTYKGETYFMKDVRKGRLLELREKIGSIIASHILNDIFKDKEKRYPLLRLAFNPNLIISYAEPFHILSEELKGFTSIADIAKDRYKKLVVKVDDLENLYMGMYLIGGGDPHMRNIFYNSQNNYLGNVDLDVSFKEHISYDNQRQQSETSSPDFFKKYSDLAVRTIDCDNIFMNFLFATDSMLSKKILWNRYYDKNIPLYKETLKMNGTKLSGAVDTLRNAFPDKEKLRLLVINTVNAIKKELKNIIIEELEKVIIKDKEKLKNETKNEARSIFDDSEDYFNKDSDAYKKYKEDSLVKSTYFLFGKEDNEDYIQEVYQFVENRYLTLICIFGIPNNIVKETCDKCLLKSEVYDYCGIEEEESISTQKNDNDNDSSYNLYLLLSHTATIVGVVAVLWLDYQVVYYISLRYGLYRF